MAQQKAKRGWFGFGCIVKFAGASSLLLYVLWLSQWQVITPAAQARITVRVPGSNARTVSSEAGPAADNPPPQPGHVGSEGEAPPPRPPSADAEVRGSSAPAAPALRQARGAGGAKTALLVALAADMGAFDGTLVVINSAVRNAADPSRMRFRIVTTAAEADKFARKLRANLPAGADVEGVNFDPWAPRVGRLTGGKATTEGARKELFNNLNFAAFYLHEVFPDSERVMYLDTDVVVLTDLAKELADHDLGGHPAAVAEDCSQRLGKYIDMDKLRKKGILDKLAPTLEIKAKKKTCVVNRGVVLINTAKWRSDNITGAIEALVAEHISPGGPLWRAGVSQPPFLLALAGRYHDLGAEYNVRGLGRSDIAPDEVGHYRALSQWSPYFDKFLLKCEVNCCPGCKGWALAPYISPRAAGAKILHFNGKNKPYKQGRRGTGPVKPPPTARELSLEERGAREQRPLCSCGANCLQECSSLWWKYLPETIL